ncbi:hypothetical protein TNCV_4862191 [Trichonephila clavipes]|nr:hypothetical protein TNCV_4862191 [Trichonephila clavipes]
MVLKTTADDRRHLAFYHDEFRGPRSGLCRSAKEDGETQVNINDENMQDLDDQQSSEKDVVQSEDMSHAPTKKCLKNGGFEFEKYVDVGFIA